MIRRIVSATSALLASLLCIPRSHAAEIAVIAQFDPNQGELPESITRDREGNILLSMAAAHALSKIVPDGKHAPVPFVTLPVPSGAFSVGLKISPDHDIFACTAAFSPALDAAHVWRVTPSGVVSDFAHLNANGFPNDIAFDENGNLFVTDSALGIIYRIERDGQFKIWLSDERLVGNPAHPLIGSPFGANGIVFDERERNIYVDNTDFGEVFRIHLERDDAPGPLQLFVANDELAGADGLAFDDRGRLYVAVDAQNQIAVIDRDGTVDVVARGAPLDNPSSLVFATDAGGETKLFISSFALAQALELVPGVPEPSLDSIRVPFRGLPLP